MLTVYIDPTYKGKLEDRIQNLKEQVDAEAILDDVGAVLLNRMKARFLAQESPNHVPWIPSKASLHRKLIGRDGGTLFDKGDLYHSIQLFNSGPNSREIATDRPYAKYHQFGTSKLPIRKFLGFNEEDQTVADLVVKHAVKNIK